MESEKKLSQALTKNGAGASREQVKALQAAMLNMPQAPGMDTDHFFIGGMYCRKIMIPKGIVIVSKTHKTDHFFIGCMGELHIAGQGDNFVLRSGDIVPSPKGTKRVVYAITDVVVLTIHKTDKTQADDDLEMEMVEVETIDLYDINNQPKPVVLVDESDKPKMEQK